MKKKLSIIALCLVVVMCFTALVACDSISGDGGNNGGNNGGGGSKNECVHVDANDDSVCDKCYRDLDVSCVHIDEDNNGKCDKCKEGVVVDFDIYAINDLHGMYVETNDQPGVDGLTTYFNKKNKTET